jgi:hypothetical protein
MEKIGSSLSASAGANRATLWYSSLIGTKGSTCGEQLGAWPPDDISRGEMPGKSQGLLPSLFRKRQAPHLFTSTGATSRALSQNGQPGQD